AAVDESTTGGGGDCTPASEDATAAAAALTASWIDSRVGLAGVMKDEAEPASSEDMGPAGNDASPSLAPYCGGGGGGRDPVPVVPSPCRPVVTTDAVAAWGAPPIDSLVGGSGGEENDGCDAAVAGVSADVADVGGDDVIPSPPTVP
ncbi:unnamed protein product, partial [Ectocarpus sp. 4 AP-2014]